MKKIIITLISLIIATLIILFTIQYLYKKNKLEIIPKQQEIEVFESLELKDLIDENINLLENQKIDTNKIGEQELIVKYKNKIFKYEDKIKINIVDKENPLILVNSITIEKGNNIDLVNKFICADNYDARPNCYIEGNYDINEIGKYNLKYVAIDTSNNKTEKEFTLTVKEPQKNTKSPQEATHTDFKEIIKIHKNQNTRIGIDVSKWQGNIDFEAVKKAGCEFVIIKVGGTYIDNELYIDPKFKINIENALKNNLDVGVYLNSKANNIELAQKEIEYVLEQIKDYEIKLGIAYDWENFTDFNSYNISLHTLNEMAKTFLEGAKNKGYKPLLYSSKYYLENMWNLNYDTWVAQYASKNTYEGDYIMWQLCSDGKIDGILGDVDIDVMYLK